MKREEVLKYIKEMEEMEAYIVVLFTDGMLLIEEYIYYDDNYNLDSDYLYFDDNKVELSNIVEINM
ncbi:hypothetical protein [uncultured Clostridium sp.]|jgi:hypothetical protein|uniref:hypothetical protein n=1 Tax=uncultured Clostridium sp. TaxID=59620 RepID=UPI0026127216|nr:hypothetical protein [uncultured Clostridium sp.]